MRQISNLVYVVGSELIWEKMQTMPALPVFSDEAIQFLMMLSRKLLSDEEAKSYPDLITFGFWCRKASLQQMIKEYGDMSRCLGRGIVFHIAPSNVAVNFAYSCAVALLAGNASVIRLPSKDFLQVDIICRVVRAVLQEMSDLEGYFLFVRYGHDMEINARYSAVCNTRVVWGGDRTIHELRQAELQPRANEITFADRHSLAVIQADKYLAAEDKQRIVQNFYDDTYLTDQNACTSPRIVIWLGEKIVEAQKNFWSNLHELVSCKYDFQPVQAVNKLRNLYQLGVAFKIQQVKMPDNLITRVSIDKLNTHLMDYKMNSGFFMEYVARDLSELKPLCDQQCQTISYYGLDSMEIFDMVNKVRPAGVDRIVPIGQSMNFSLIWDGYNLIQMMSRVVSVH